MFTSSNDEDDDGGGDDDYLLSTYCAPGPLPTTFREISLNPHNSSMVYTLLLSSFYRWEKWGLERWSNLLQELNEGLSDSKGCDLLLLQYIELTWG